MSSRHVEIEKVVHGHGCEKFRANNASEFVALLQAIEAGETDVELTGNVLDIKVLAEYIKKSTVAREAGERPTTKINKMIKGGELQWVELRHPGGRLYGYKLPVSESSTSELQEQDSLPSLEGSDKQVKWARALRLNKIREAEGLSETMRLEFLHLVEKCTNAEYWIDNREKSVKMMLTSGTEIGWKPRIGWKEKTSTTIPIPYRIRTKGP